MGKRSRTQKRAPIGAKEGQRLRIALGATQRRIRELGEEREEARREVAELRRAVAAHAEQLEALMASVELLARREQELRAMLLGAHDQLMRRADEIRTTLTSEMHRQQVQPRQNTPRQNTSEARASVLAPAQIPVPGEYSEYQQRVAYLYRRLIARSGSGALHTAPEATGICK